MAIPRHFIFFDTETVQTVSPNGDIQQDFKLGWACYWQRAHGRHKERIEWFYIETPSLFWDFVFSKVEAKQRLWIIARNVVFDFTVCKGWEHLKREGYKLKFFHNNGVSVIVTVSKGNKSIVFLDSMNWFTESLEKTGDRIGIPKMKIDFNICTVEQLSIYCRNDVLIEFENFRLFIRFLQGNTISRLCYTKASTAMAAYLLRHYNTSIFIHNNAEACKLERDSYKGGRCECFYIGELNHENYYVLDVNSLYPYVMANNIYPVKYTMLKHNISPSKLCDYMANNTAIASVSIKTDKPVYAVKDKRTIFPIGTFDTVLTTPEIKYALEHGHIQQVYDCVIYEQANIFSSYVTTMYALRQDFASAGVKEYEVLCKYLLNSLYGKFGQKAEHWQKIGDAPDEPDREEMIFCDNPRRIMRLRYLLGQVFELKGYSEAFNSFPAIASHVTAYGRMYLWQLMQIAGQGNYYYCDTDSLIVNHTGYLNLYDYIDETEIGKLKHEDTITHLILYGLKDYVTSAKTAIKGIRKNAIELEKGVYQQELWPSFKGIFKTLDANTYTVRKVIKHLHRDYQKGNVSETGIVTPYVYS
jgi:DNA polymerase elongation subunit (family B)